MTISQSDYSVIHSQFAVGCAELLQAFMHEILSGERIDRISSRAKSSDRFMAKAGKKNIDGSAKYQFPLSEIQDIIGVRVIVLYLEDISSVREKIGKWFRLLEDKSVAPTDERTFSYFGHHSILRIPDECRPDCALAEDIKFFELQIKTMFQHAWSEAEHDLLYKPLTGTVLPEHNRLTGFAASLAWGADKAFQEILESMGPSAQK